MKPSARVESAATSDHPTTPARRRRRASPRTTAVRLRFATGYLGLGMLEAASAELRGIPRTDRKLADVLAAQAELCLERRDWQGLLRIAKELARRHETDSRGWIHWAYALRELNMIQGARDVLLTAKRLHPELGVLHFNLACYYCLLGDFRAAKRSLDRACQLKADWKEAALQDPDLKDFWDHYDPEQFG